MPNKKLLSSIFLVVFIDLLGFSLILPLLPFYAETFGAGPFLVGLLVASYAATQLIGAPILGRLSDRLGRRPVLLVSILGNMGGFLLLGFANSLYVLFAARMLAGLTGGNISVAQAYISDVTDAKERTRSLGLIGAAFGLGFIIGPAVGGILSRWGFMVPALAAAVLSVINFALVALWLPESLTAERKRALAYQEQSSFTAKILLEVLRRPLVGPLLYTRFFFGMAFSTFQTIFALYGQYRFGLNSGNTGYILAYVGVLSALTQGVLIGRLTRRFSDSQLLFFATVLMAFSLLGWAFAPSIAVLLLVLIPIAISGGVLNTVVNSAISKSVTPAEVGGILGLAASLESFTRVVAPSLAGVLLGVLGTSAPGVFSALILAALTLYIWRFIFIPENPAVRFNLDERD